MEQYYRQPTNIDNADQDIVFQAISWLDKDIIDTEGIDDPTEVPPEYVIFLSGVTKDGMVVNCKITNFIPYFYVRIPDEFYDTWEDYQTNVFYRFLRKKINGLTSAKLVKKTTIYPFVNNEKQKYIRLCFNSITAFRRCSYTLKNPITISQLSTNSIKFKLYETNVDPITRFTHIRDIRTAGWIHIIANTYKLESDQQDNFIKITLHWRDIHPYLVEEKECEDIAPFRILSWDIECQSSRGYPEFPDPEIDGDYISQIGCALWIFGKKEVVKYVLSIYESRPIKEGHLIVCKDEKELLTTFCELIQKLDPDVLTGYNTWGFDDKYLYARIQKFNLDYLLQGISRIDEIETELMDKNLSSGAYGHNEFKILYVPGRETFDMIMFIRREHKLDSYKLNRVSIHFGLDKGKEDMPYKLLFEILNKGNESPQEMGDVCEYCVQDSNLVIELMEKLCFIPNSIEMAKSTRVPISWLLLKGQQCKVFSQLAYEARKKDFVIPLFGSQNDEKISEEEEKKFKGATVLTARKGAYYDPVCGLDFKSLYPSIMIAYNMCYSTLVTEERYMGLEGVEYETIAWKQKEDDGSVTDFSYTFVQNRKGILPDILERLWKDRNKTKKEMKACKGTFRAQVLNGKQLAIKVTMNSVYGFTGASKGMGPCKPIAASVTAKGREMIAHTSKLAEEMYNCVTTYGDSVPYYQKVKIRLKGEVMDIPIGDLFNKYNGDAPLVEYTGGGRQKEQLLMSRTKVESWTHNGWEKLRRVIRHKTKKKLYKVITDKGEVVVTEDHSLIDHLGNQIKPNQIYNGQKLLWKKC